MWSANEQKDIKFDFCSSGIADFCLPSIALAEAKSAKDGGLSRFPVAA
jgi:hypothetical protein